MYVCLEQYRGPIQLIGFSDEILCTLFTDISSVSGGIAYLHIPGDQVLLLLQRVSLHSDMYKVDRSTDRSCVSAV
jgi:hypothetical protein